MSAPKIVNCYLCGTKVGELSPGTKWKKNSKGVCEKCLNKDKQTDSNDYDFVSDLLNICKGNIQ